MIATLVKMVIQNVPSVRRAFWRRWYQFLAGTYRQEFWSFMNYGFVPEEPDSKKLDLDEDDEPDRYCIQLYYHVAGAIDLTGLDVLEVGCGRGGGAAFIAKQLKPKSMTGLDFSEKAIGFCRTLHSAPNLSFLPGDAENLPFGEETFDAVVNVESSHCYGSMARFLGEVSRVLKPGGYFLYADLRGKDQVPDLLNDLRNSGMQVLEHSDITRNVTRALELDDDRKRALIKSSIHKPLTGWFLEFAGVRESTVYERFHRGENVYSSFVMRK